MNVITQVSSLKCGKILIGIWLLVIGIVVVIPSISLVQGEVLGGIVFSFLPAAILQNISIIIASFSENITHKIAKAGWVILCLAEILIVFLIADPHQVTAYRDVELILSYTMFTLSFPLGLISPFLLWVCGLLADNIMNYFGLADPSNFEIQKFYLAMFSLWFSFFLIGYFQWFKLLPFIIKKWRK